MLKRIQSAISTAHAISLAIREAPDAIRECVEFARDNANQREQLADTYKAITEYSAACSKLSSEITEARELLSGLSSGLGYGLGGEDESLPSMIGRVRDGVVENLKVMTEMRDKAQDELGIWCNWACSLSGVYGTDAEIRSAVESEIQRIINHWTGVCNEWRDKCESAQKERDEFKANLAEMNRALVGMNRLYDEQCKATIAARENIEGLYTETAKERDELKTRVENQATEIATLRNQTTMLDDERRAAKAALSYLSDRLNETEAAYNAASNERDKFRARAGELDHDVAVTTNELVRITNERDILKYKLDRHEAAERWHQVTAGEGELPPKEVTVIYRLSAIAWPTIGNPRDALYMTYEWRHLSSKDVPNV